jgi:hypothetical protein
MTIFYILVAVIVGWFIGFLDSNLRTAKKIRAVEANAEMMIEEAQKKAAQTGNKIAAEPALQDDPGLLRLKKKDGRFLLELDGAPVTGELSLETRKRLMELITVFRLWLDPAPSATPRPVAPTPTLPVADSVREAVSRPVPSAPNQPLAPAKKPEVEKNIASLSIVQQIDTILQERILDTPLAKRGIRLQESVQGGVEVYVGLQKFHSVDDVTDEVVKNTIRAAIAEWEKKYTPGM